MLEYEAIFNRWGAVQWSRMNVDKSRTIDVKLCGPQESL